VHKHPRGVAVQQQVARAVELEIRPRTLARTLRSHRQGSDKVEELRARGMPLGLMPEMSCEEIEAVLREKDSVLFYSNGPLEAHYPYCEMFGFPRLWHPLYLAL
jgi:Stage II sporulation protein E (SpoIIE)